MKGDIAKKAKKLIAAFTMIACLAANESAYIPYVEASGAADTENNLNTAGNSVVEKGITQNSNDNLRECVEDSFVDEGEEYPSAEVSGDSGSQNMSGDEQNHSDFAASTKMDGDGDAGVSNNSVLEEGVSEDSVSNYGTEQDIVLETEEEGTIITLTGPAGSFESGRVYELRAEAIKEPSAKGREIKEAVDGAAQAEDLVAEKCRAFDIRLFSEGEEVQPLGPVSVNFSSSDIKKSVTDENTDVNVFYIDEKTNHLQAENMGAETEKNGTVTMETTHFTIYVVVDMGQQGGHIKVLLEHWGTGIKTISANGTTDPFYVKYDPEKDSQGRQYGLYTHDDVYDRHTQQIIQQDYTGEIYSPDTMELEDGLNGSETTPNFTIESLSKIIQGMSNVSVDKRKYTPYEIWISTDLSNKGKERDDWKEGSYRIYNVSVGADGDIKADSYIPETGGTAENFADPSAVTLTKDCLIRFWYKETDAGEMDQTTTFFDYNIADPGKRSGADKGINADINFIPADNKLPKMGMGQNSSGNWSDFAGGSSTEGVCEEFGLLNRGNRWDNIPGACKIDEDARTYIESISSGRPGSASGEDLKDLYRRTAHWAVPVKGLVQDTLTADYQLQFSKAFRQPQFFAEGPGKVKLGEYTLGFKQKGDTYTLSNVKKNGIKTLDNLEKILYTISSYGSHSNIYSNNFFPLDSETGGDAKGTGSDDGKEHNWHFGMHYAFEFTIGDYTGPMNYYFRGDDDFWLFVDGVKAVDLGGIHSSVGQAIDLRKWMEDHGMLDQPQAKHRLDVYYMERGGFGSCCYIQFTLPNCSEVNDLTADYVYSHSAKLKWIPSANEKIAGYYIYRDGKLIADVTGDTYEDKNLSSETIYNYTVIGHTESGEEASVAAISLTTRLPVVSDMYTENGSNQVGQMNSYLYAVVKDSGNLENGTGRFYYLNKNKEKIQIGSDFASCTDKTGAGGVYKTEWDITEIESGDYTVIFEFNECSSC